MLSLKQRNTGPKKKPMLLLAIAVLFGGGGMYLLTLVGAPAISPLIGMQSIDLSAIEEPTVGHNRIIIPKIGVDIEYGEGEVALDNGAEWRFPERGDPASGGNFIIAAHRFTLAPTPSETVRKSPFYNIERLSSGDEIIVDYNGKRYGYTVSETFDVKPNKTEIESADIDSSRLTLYSCGLGGADDSRVVLFGQPLGEVTVSAGNPGRS